MARSLSLHPLNALDVDPAGLIAIAGRLGVGHVCLFTHVPEAAAGFYPMVGPADVDGVRHALDGEGVRLCNLEVFPLDQDGPLDHLLAGLETGARLGATKATVHIHDVAGEAQAIDRFAAFADRAAGFGITAGLEFNNFSAVRDVAAAERIVRAAGRGALVLDALHLIRGGGGPADLARVADLVGYVQLSDGPLEMPMEGRWAEAVRDRLPPGEGEFPLAEIVRASPLDAIYDFEVPQSTARKAGVDPFERCHRVVEAGRRLLQTIDEELPA
jgi:sugar phosphate isomerase/epimerase